MEENAPLNSDSNQNFTHLKSASIENLKSSSVTEELEVFDKLTRLVQSGNFLDLENILGHCKSKEFIEFQAEGGKTLLHIAAENSQAECLRVLLENGADPNKLDVQMGRSPLHWALDGGCHCEHCSSRIIKCIEKLFEYGAESNLEDYNEDTPLLLAAKSMLPKCALVLIDHGGVYTKNNDELGQMLVERMPEVFHRILDKGINYDKGDKTKLKLDFGWMFKTPKPKTRRCPPSLRFKTKITQFSEMSILLKLTKVDLGRRKAILTHPFLEAFLHLKWLAVRKWFWLIRMVYGLFLVFYSYFIFEIFVWRCPYSSTQYSKNNSSDSEEIFNNQSNISIIDKNCQPKLPNILLYVCGTVAVLVLFCMVLNEIFEFKQDKRAYLRSYLNLLWWNLILSLIVTTLPAFGVEPQPWQYPVAAFGLFYAWGMNFTQLSRLPVLGDYIEMLGKVVIDFFMFVITFMSVIIAFTLSMCVMFPENDFFKNVPLGFVKVLIIMIGEADYDGLFKENDRLDDLEYSIPAHIMYVAFIFIVTIVLMNLLLALAVNDIQELRKESAIKRAVRQITQISMLETFINNVGIGTWLASHVLRRSSVQATFGQYFTFSPLNTLDNRLPAELKHKFISYLASSPCLKRHKRLKLRTILAPIRWKNFKTTDVKREDGSIPAFNSINYEHVNKQGIEPTISMGADDMEEIRLMFKSLADSLHDITSQLEKLSIRIDRKL